MTVAQYIKNKDIRLLVDPASLKTHKEHAEQFITDTRSYQKDNMWYVFPIGATVDNVSVDIVCPYCGKIHRHSNDSGHRCSHCLNPNNPGYVIVIERRPFNE